MSDSSETIDDKIGLDQKFIAIIDGKLKKIYAILEKVMYDKGDDATVSGKFGRMLNRNVYGSWFTHELLRELTLLNSYFIIYENKVKHIIKKKEFGNDLETNKKNWGTLFNKEDNVGKLFMANISKTAFGPTVFEVSEEKAKLDKTTVSEEKTVSEETTKDPKQSNDSELKQSNNTMDTASKITSESFLGLGAVLIALSSNSKTVTQAATTAAAIGTATISIAVPPFGVGLIALGFLAGKAIQLTRNKTELLYVAEECATIVQECFKMHCANAALLHVFCNDNNPFTVIDTTKVENKVKEWKTNLKKEKYNGRFWWDKIKTTAIGGRKTRRNRQQKKRKINHRKSKRR